MEYRDNGTRYENYSEWDSLKNNLYDYKRKGLIRHLLSKTIINTNNDTLKIMLTYFEQSIIFVLKYVDRLKHFKNYHWKNR